MSGNWPISNLIPLKYFGIFKLTDLIVKKMTVIVEPPSAQINRKSRKNVEMVVAYRNIRKKVDCVEAQRIMYILNQLQRRLLLLGKHFIIFTTGFITFYYLYVS